MFLKGHARLALVALGWLMGVFLLAPTLIVFPIGLNDSRFVVMPDSLSALSLRHVVNVLTEPTWLTGIRDSLIVAVSTAIFSTVIGLAFSIGVWRVKARWTMALTAILVAPMIVPPIISAVALYHMWTAIGLYDTWIGVILAHTIVAAPYSALTVSASLALLDPRLEQASRSLGASRLRTVADVILPNIKGGVAAGALFAFIMSWDELVLTLFVANRVVYTLPRKMWDGIRENVDPSVAAISALLVLLTISVLAITHFLRSTDPVRRSH
ncbi:ABC transporter permease [Mesorhizobium sp. IMUNJ 23033]|uniref:ABC transporter permease n=1 Tax=Mesorhizobium sp. IMUNJ 23033 TaxID=3378039 RepID=UPI0038502B61